MSLPMSVFIASTMRRLGDADEDDRLLVVDQLDAGDDALRIDADQDVDRLAGIADRAGEIGVQVDVAEQPVALVDGDERRIALRRAEAVGAGKEIRRRAFDRYVARPSAANAPQEAKAADAATIAATRTFQPVL